MSLQQLGWPRLSVRPGMRMSGRPARIQADFGLSGIGPVRFLAAPGPTRRRWGPTAPRSGARSGPKQIGRPGYFHTCWAAKYHWQEIRIYEGNSNTHMQPSVGGFLQIWFGQKAQHTRGQKDDIARKQLTTHDITDEPPPSSPPLQVGPK